MVIIQISTDGVKNIQSVKLKKNSPAELQRIERNSVKTTMRRAHAPDEPNHVVVGNAQKFSPPNIEDIILTLEIAN